ncbi:MAG: hypothetical protein ABWK01_00705 [Infirmifilum sp.]
MHQEVTIAREVEALIGKALADIALEALYRVSLLGLPIDPAKTSDRGVVVRYEDRKAFFRVIPVVKISGGYTLCLRRYTADCGEVATIKPGGEVEYVLLKIPAYLSSPGELFNGYVADVWVHRLDTVASGNLVACDPREMPEGVREVLENILEKEGVSVQVNFYYSPHTLDYVAGVLEKRVLPIWVNSVNMTVSVSRNALKSLKARSNA